MKEAVKAGAGPAVLSILAVHDELASGQLIEVAITGLDLSRPLTAVWPRGRALSEPSLALLALADTARA